MERRGPFDVVATVSTNALPHSNAPDLLLTILFVFYSFLLTVVLDLFIFISFFIKSSFHTIKPYINVSVRYKRRLVTDSSLS